ncbi:putative endopeptidase [Nocardioides aquaticus]|uniref:Endopeptidase n=2 Tax=Nocardioides aquaticus TaxID=160826 RepID=A0ABX8EE89_9ACTN|nr:C40 family peptidase [Nocardioides aquaticus]QVT78190.1 putative endopeptidase [Nocardioides aquaticus]
MHRPRGTVRRLAPSLIALTVLSGVLGVPAAQADPADPAPVPVPSRAEIDAAAGEAEVAEMDLATVRAQLAAAELEVQESAERAARAAEAYNGARWRAEQADEAADRREVLAADAADEAADLREAYADAVLTGYEQAPTMTALSSLTRADGIGAVVDRTSALRMATEALDERTREAEGAARGASAERTTAVADRMAADAAADEAAQARDLAAATARSAASQATLVADQRDALVARAAALQGVSTALAARRQAGLEARAAARTQAAVAAQATAQAGQAGPDGVSDPADQGLDAASDRAPAPVPPPATPDLADLPAIPDVPPAPAPLPALPAAAAAPAASASVPSATGGAAAVAFARQQLGEPYVWAAAGPDSWDCSGLTMGAWAAGGTSLPHYSVAQYEASTPIAPSDLQPGDLVFWGDSSDPGSIFHVALYAGNDMIIHAPRTGRPVVEESIYYWRLPDFYARP